MRLVLVSKALPISINPLSCTPLFLRDNCVSARLLRSTYREGRKEGGGREGGRVRGGIREVMLG